MDPSNYKIFFLFEKTVILNELWSFYSTSRLVQHRNLKKSMLNLKKRYVFLHIHLVEIPGSETLEMSAVFTLRQSWQALIFLLQDGIRDKMDWLREEMMFFPTDSIYVMTKQCSGSFYSG